jgi:hypothetical protein
MLPLAYFPTRVVFIDDNHFYLKILIDQLSNEKREHIAFTEAKQGIDYLNSLYKPGSFLNQYITQIDEDQFEHRACNIAIQDIHQEIYNNLRFKQV